MLRAELDAQAASMKGQMDAQAAGMRAEMTRMQNAMQIEMEELHSQNQLLLSKISALSSQNSNAPGIFDGADRRKRAAKEEKLRESGQTVAPTVRRRQLAFFVSRLPLPF